MITNKLIAYKARYRVIYRLCREVAEARRKTKFSLLIGHGGGSFAHVSAQEYKITDNKKRNKNWKGFAHVQNDAARLNRILLKSLLNVDIKAVSFQPSACSIANNNLIKQWYLEP